MSVGEKVYARPDRIVTLRRSAEIELLEVLTLSDHNPTNGNPRFTSWEVLEREIRSLHRLWISHWSFFHPAVRTEGPAELMTLEGSSKLEIHHAAEMYRLAIVVDQAERLRALVLLTSSHLRSTMEELSFENTIRLSWWVIERMSWRHRPGGRGTQELIG
jgi:hypothetical protein